MPDSQPVELMGIDEEEEEEDPAWEYQIHTGVRPWECPWSLGAPMLGGPVVTPAAFLWDSSAPSSLSPNFPGRMLRLFLSKHTLSLAF